MRKSTPDILRWISVAFLIAAVVTIFYELVSYSRSRAVNPETMTVAGVPVGGLTREETTERLVQVYGTDLELYYGEERILLNPAAVGFSLDTEVMIAAAEEQRSEAAFWQGFWDFLWNRPAEEVSIPLRSEFSASQLETFLQDIAVRYDIPPLPPEPIPGSPTFGPGTPGKVLDIERSIDLIAESLNDSEKRSVVLVLDQETPLRATMQTLEILIKQNLDVEDFDGLASIYIRDLWTGEELHFSYYQNEDIPVEPDIAFTAASTNKISIMLSYYRYFDLPFDAEAERWVREMITESGNDPADWLMDRMTDLGELPGPLMVTRTVNEDLGLSNTFIVGFYRTSPILRIMETPGNQRPDIFTRPDPYNQTSAGEIGLLLSDIYACANNGGSLLAAFPGEITSQECQQMLDIMSENYLGSLIQGGVPDGTRVAHKHGWTQSPLDMVSDAGIVFSPGGDYVLSIFLWNDPEMIWTPTSRIVANLSKAVYNYYNSPVEE
ncbi:MAG: serine hydrolase [Anaerolineales bacterium]|nr:serine hydrolase [Anaerolineales bacterium]